MRRKAVPVITMANAVVQHRIQPPSPQHTLGSDALMDAHGTPWHPFGDGFDRPDYILRFANWA